MGGLDSVFVLRIYLGRGLLWLGLDIWKIEV